MTKRAKKSDKRQNVKRTSAASGIATTASVAGRNLANMAAVMASSAAVLACLMAAKHIL